MLFVVVNNKYLICQARCHGQAMRTINYFNNATWCYPPPLYMLAGGPTIYRDKPATIADQLM